MTTPETRTAEELEQRAQRIENEIGEGTPECGRVLRAELRAAEDAARTRALEEAQEQIDQRAAFFAPELTASLTEDDRSRAALVRKILFALKADIRALSSPPASQRPQISAEEQEKRRPPPPESLVGALQDPHPLGQAAPQPEAGAAAQPAQAQSAEIARAVPGQPEGPRRLSESEINAIMAGYGKWLLSKPAPVPWRDLLALTREVRARRAAHAAAPPDLAPFRDARDFVADILDIADHGGLSAEATAHARSLLDRLNAALRSPSPAPPIDMVLHCPGCGAQHVDAPELGTDWTNPPHKSHKCHGCPTIWRPADVPTNGVAATKTRGKADTAPLDRRYAAPPALHEGPNLWIGYCDLCNGQHCVQLLKENAGEIERRPHRAAPPAQEGEAEPWKLLEKATVRIEILLGRARACPSQNDLGTHDLSLLEGEGWIKEQRAALAQRAPGKEK